MSEQALVSLKRARVVVATLGLLCALAAAAAVGAGMGAQPATKLLPCLAAGLLLHLA
jgi:hypothetical protein